jgi:hypothetical protein
LDPDSRIEREKSDRERETAVRSQTSEAQAKTLRYLIQVARRARVCRGDAHANAEHSRPHLARN